MKVVHEPVAVSHAVAVAIPVIVSALIALGVIDWDSDTQARVTAGILAVIFLGISAVSAWRARAAVTPLARPRDGQRRYLVPLPPRADEFQP